MAFEKLPGNRGQIYIPDNRWQSAKHPCRDCFACQWCSDDRCSSCRPAGCCRPQPHGEQPPAAPKKT